jgi:predicted ATPase
MHERKRREAEEEIQSGWAAVEIDDRPVNIQVGLNSMSKSSICRCLAIIAVSSSSVASSIRSINEGTLQTSSWVTVLLSYHNARLLTLPQIG